MKKLTVAIPNFNGGMNLQRAIESCRSIDLPENDFEILIVDNCSTDDSIKIINESKIKIPNIRLIENQENVGRIGNWNVCLKEAQGKYLIFLFTNDFINDQNNIKDVIDVLESDETISLAISPLVKKLKNVNILKKRFFDETIKCLSKKYSVECLQRGFLPFGPIQSVIYRMKDVQKLECIFEPDLPIDADDLFSFNMALNSRPVRITDSKTNRTSALIKLDNFIDTYLYIVKFLDPNVMKYLQQTSEAVTFYFTVQESKTGIKITFAIIYLLIVSLLLFH